MSKLEDKLAASIKPSPRQVSEGTSAAAPAPQAKPKRTQTPAPKPRTAEPDPNDVNQPLHPDRIWPD